MSFDWKNWCRFCGNVENNVKFEFSLDVEHYFKISDPSPKICEECNLYLSGFECFVERTEKVNKLFKKLRREKSLDNFKINRLREKLNFSALDFESNEKPVEQPMIAEHLDIVIKQEPGIDLEFEYNDYKDSCSTGGDDTKFKYNPNKTSSDEEETWQLYSKPGTSSGLQKSATKSSKKFLSTICHICHVEFPSMVFLEKHCHTDHNCRPQVPCICGYLLDHYKIYYHHRKRCGKWDAPLQCDHCPNTYFNKKLIERHLIKKHQTTSVRHICLTCGKEFRKQFDLRFHERTHLPEELKNIYPCPQCGKKFGTRGNVVTHVKTVHNKEKHIKPYTCHICAKGYFLKPSLEAHLITHTTELNFQCSTCEKKFKTKCLLRSHEKVHEPDQYFCEICNKGFRRFSSRTKHMTVHTDEKPFDCPEPTCSQKFKRKESAKDHYKEIHLGQKRYTCRVCNAGFYQAKDRISHLKEYHPVEYLEHEKRYEFHRKNK